MNAATSRWMQSNEVKNYSLELALSAHGEQLYRAISSCGLPVRWCIRDTKLILFGHRKIVTGRDMIIEAWLDEYLPL